MNRIDWKRGLKGISQIAWILFFVSLPVTSFPFFPSDVGGKTLVRPLAVYPLVVLLALLIVPRLFKKPLPQTFIPLLAFTTIALISAVFAFTSDLEAFRGVTPVSRLLRNLISLGLGISFYFTTVLLHESWEDLSRSLRWLYAGLALALFWGTVQLPILVLGSSFYYRAVNFIQRFISTRKLFTTRISGLTFEPKWFAEQICFLFLPWLITSVLMNRSSFRWRWHRITIELILLVWSVVILIFTFSRTGVFILIVLTFVGYLLFHFRFHKKTPRLQKSMHRRILEASAIVLVLSAVLVIIGAQNPYFSRLWRYWTEAKTRNRTYLEFIAVEQRFVYTETALRIYDVNPWLGVGLGNYAFYFTEKLPNHPWSTQREIIRQITPGEGRDRLITPKNLIARLIAETGILGTGSFATFVLGVVGSALYLWFSPTVEQKYWGLGAALAMLVFAFAIFSFDSFALPNMWIVFGLITSAAHLPDPGSPPGAVEIVQPNID